MKLSQNQLEELEQKIRELVPNLGKSHQITLEAVLKAMQRWWEMKDGWTYGIALDGGFMKIRASAYQEEDLLPHHLEAEESRGLWEDCENSCWTFLQPWEEQHDVHAFLYELLITKQHENK